MIIWLLISLSHAEIKILLYVCCKLNLNVKKYNYFIKIKIHYYFLVKKEDEGSIY